MRDVLDVEEVIVDRIEIDGKTAYFHESWFNWLDSWLHTYIEDKQMDAIYESYERCLD